jgi:hypothetical protein
MSYCDLLHPWYIVQLLPNAQPITVARFRRRSEAESYLRVVKQLLPESGFAIVFDPSA